MSQAKDTGGLRSPCICLLCAEAASPASPSKDCHPIATDSLQFMLTCLPKERLAIDIVGPLLSTKREKRYILAVVECLTRVDVAEPIRTQSGERFAPVIIKIGGCVGTVHPSRSTTLKAPILKVDFLLDSSAPSGS